MEEYYSWGGASNPEFYYKVNVNTLKTEMYHWCKNYTSDKGVGRFYIAIKGANLANKTAEFQFETEEPAIMFALMFGDK